MKTISILEKELVEAFQQIKVLEIAVSEQKDIQKNETKKLEKMKDNLHTAKCDAQRLESGCKMAYSTKLEILLR